MALVRFHKGTWTLDMIVGINETFKPKKAIKDLNQRLVDLKAEVVKEIQKFGVEGFNDISTLSEEKQKELDAVFQATYIPTLGEILKEIEEINKKSLEKNGS